MTQNLQNLLNLQEIENIVRRLNNSGLVSAIIKDQLHSMGIKPMAGKGVISLYSGEDVFRYLRSLERQRKIQPLPYESIRTILDIGLHLPLRS